MVFFFFKQKTAYEMRISDWSSDVCSSDLDEIFRNNLARLEEIYNGMRIFFDLYQRKMVSAPYIASSQEIVTQDDPNTMIVGDTTFRITIPSSLAPTVANWKALLATPKTDKQLPVVKSPKLDRVTTNVNNKIPTNTKHENARPKPH